MSLVRLALVVFAVLLPYGYAAAQQTDPVRVFESGLTFSQFLARAHAQRDIWVRNASRTPVSPAAVRRLARVRDGLRLLIVAEDWCVDSVHTVPYVANLAAAAGVPLRLVDRMSGDPVASAHRAPDGRPVTPVIILLRDDRDVGAWVERPAPLQQLFSTMVGDAAKTRQFETRDTWYDADRGRTTIEELLTVAERTARK